MRKGNKVYTLTFTRTTIVAILFAIKLGDVVYYICILARNMILGNFSPFL